MTISPGDIITSPQGGGALQGIGEKFSPDLFTGTGNFNVPIAVPPGRNGFKPQLSLSYSTGNGNGPFGLGWALSVPGITRKTSKGIPQFDDAHDIFILSGSEDLVPVESPATGVMRYQPRTEGLFARIKHFRLPHGSGTQAWEENYWQVESKDGLVSIYGTPQPTTAPPTGWREPAGIVMPGQVDHLFAWKLTSTRDPFGNTIRYEYVRDSSQIEGVHSWDQVYLSRIRYVDYGDPSNPSFLVSVKFTYANRPDHFSDYRAGFEIRTIQRCTQIDIFGGTDGLTPIRTYHLDYLDQEPTLSAQQPMNGSSVLHQVRVEGHDGANSEWLPPLEFGYTQFQPTGRKFVALGGSLPTSSLGDKSLELVDLFGAGLPDILEMNGTVRYWRNTGEGQFALPHQMDEAPAGIGLADPGVQILDANGDGRADLLVTTQAISGYYPLKFGGLWDGHSFQRYRVAPSFDLKDPEVRFVDLDGDGVTDAIRSSTRLECYFNDPEQGWIGSTRAERKTLDVFPDVDFADERVKWADMTGDGLQDVVLVHDGLVEYWPSLGRGKWGARVEMPGPRFPWGYDPKRILLGDVDGDGAADLVYVDNMRVTLWINQGGNGWGSPISIEGTPSISDMDSVRFADLLGNGVGGVLWSKNSNGVSRSNYFFLDFTGGVKPYLLHEMNNHMGSNTQVDYKPSTWYYLQDEQRPETRWVTPLPFPVQVVARVETTDQFSGGKLTAEYSYHHGYWDGYEREFRGFGRVDHRDTEVFSSSTNVPPQYFSPPTETRTWFHQGAIGDKFDGWAESDSLPGLKNFTDEYYQEPWPGQEPNAQVLFRPAAVSDFLAALPSAVRRDALRSMRGNILRTELYALDGTERENRPYTVTEHVCGVREVPRADSTLSSLHIFFPFSLSERTTQWERGNDPLGTFKFTDDCVLAGTDLRANDYDAYGQPLSVINVAVPRGRVFQSAGTSGQPYLATQTVTTYAQPDDPQIYILDRSSSAATYEIVNDGSASLYDLIPQIQGAKAPKPTRNVVNHNLSFYDGDPFQGLPFSQIGLHGALMRVESLVLTDDILKQAYGASIPPYLSHTGPPNWTSEYPQEFQKLLPGLAGYVYQDPSAGPPYVPGYYRLADQRRYDFQEAPPPSSRGLLTGKHDALNNETTISYDEYAFLPITVTQVIPGGAGSAAGLSTQATYDYRVFQPNLLADVNGNQMGFTFTPLGLLATKAIRGKPGENKGDLARASVQLTYDFLALVNNGQPILVHTTQYVHHDTETDVPQPERDQTIEKIEYSDGMGRLLQTRQQAEDVLFDSASPNNPVFGDAGLPPDQTKPAGDAVGQQPSTGSPFVVVSGWQVYDNKGQVVEKFEPFFSTGWNFTAPSATQLGQKATLYYDPRGHVVRIVNPDGSEQRVVYGVPGTIAAPDLTNPELFEPTPWEAYTYDVNDNAGRTHPSTSTDYQQDWNTPSSIVVDALGRTVLTVARNRDKQANGSWSPIVEYTTRFIFDIRGNLLTVTDALGRVAFTHAYDFTNRALLSQSIDGGSDGSVLDAANNVVEQRRDIKGSLTLHAYDALNRCIRGWARDASGQSVTLREKTIFADDATDSGFTAAQAAALNLLGKAYQHYDEAGLLTFSSYDFKGNMLDKKRNVIAEANLLAIFNSPPANWNLTPFRVDWATAAGGLLDLTLYETTLAYDALNRVKSMQYPQDAAGARKLIVPTYNRAGALESVKMDGATYAEHIAYNAKGQRILISYGNGLMTRYAYDPRSFRMLRMRTERYAIPLPEPFTYHPSAPAAPLQEFAYEFDLAGNILAIHDRTPGSGVQNTPLGVDALDRNFVYDPIYRLISATGRECDSPPPPPPWNDLPRCTDITKTRPYTETYQYDLLGNMLLWSHSQLQANGSVSTTNRQLTLVAGNNRLSQLSIGSTSYSYTYDPAGNLTQENTERHFEWDQSDRMRVFRVQPSGAPPSLYAQYLYDSAGQRVMKLVRDQSGGYETTIYIDGAFERQRSITSSATVDNNLLHVMDNQKRIALVRVGDPLPGDGAPDKKIKYQFGDHLGSSSVVVDDTGAWISREEYLPYGETSFGSFARKRYRFTGQERDAESGLYYHGARYYAPWLTRWASCDPSGPADGLNLYLAMKNNPILYVDKTGRIGEGPTQNADNVLPQPGGEGYGAPYRKQPKNVTIGGEPAWKEHVIPGAQPEKVTFDPTTGQADYRNQGPEYRSDYTVLNPKSKAMSKTHESGSVPSDNARTRAIETMQEDARAGKGPGASFNQDILKPSIDKAVESGMEEEAANRGALNQAANLFKSQRLQESGAKAAAFEARASTLKSVAGAAKQTVKSLIPGSDVYDEIKLVGGGSAAAGLRLMASSAAQTARVAGGAIASAASEVGATLTAEVSAGLAATAAVTTAAVVGAAGAVTWAVEDTRRALRGEKTMTDEAMETWGGKGFVGTFQELWFQIRTM